MTFEEARAEFPVFERLAYLNAGSNGPLARTTVDATIAQERADLETGRAGPAYFDRALELREEVRRKLAAAVGVPEERLALAISTTNGCNIVLAGLDLGPGSLGCTLAKRGQCFPVLRAYAGIAGPFVGNAE